MRPRKFEHITVTSNVKRELEDVLIEIVGLRTSDRAEDGASWMRAGEEHHGASIIKADVNVLHHYAWQTEGWDAIHRMGDHLAGHGRRFLWGPGHHGIGDNYFCYYYDDDDAIVEYTANMAHIVDEAHYEPGLWPDNALSINRWGYPPPVEFLEGGVRLADGLPLR